MPCIRNGRILLVMALGISSAAWGQGGRAGRAATAAPQRGPPASTPGSAPAPASVAGRGGRGADAGGGTSEFYNYDATAGSGPVIADAPPTETHQKITINGGALAYTARAGYMPLRNATTGQSEAHLFYTCYAKDGVPDTAVRPVLFF